MSGIGTRCHRNTQVSQDNFYSKDVNVARLIRGLNAEVRNGGSPVERAYRPAAETNVLWQQSSMTAIGAVLQGDCAIKQQASSLLLRCRHAEMAIRGPALMSSIESR